MISVTFRKCVIFLNSKSYFAFLFSLVVKVIVNLFLWLAPLNYCIWKILYSIYTIFQIEASANRLKPGEREFIISPLYGAMLMQATTNKQMTEHKYWANKKPFDWMLDEQFLNLQV